jgi:signal transduction histidine kinase
MSVPDSNSGRSDLDFRLLFEAAPIPFMVMDRDLTIVAASEAYVAVSMARREDFIGRGVFEAFPDNPDDPAANGVASLRESLQRVLALGKPEAMAVQRYDIRRPPSLGGGFEERYWSPVNAPVLTPEGEVGYIIQRVEDVTEFVRLKEAYRVQEARAGELQDQSARMEAEVFQRAQEIQEANRALRELQAELERRVQARTEELTRANEALRGREEQLRQAQKMEAVGRLAGGIAHDFNNLLTVILGGAERLGGRLEGDRDVAAILAAAVRASGLTNQLLAFSRQQVLAPQALDLGAVLEGLAPILHRILGEDITLEVRSTPDLRRIVADPGQVEQVVLNLAINARDAMPGGGTLLIEAANADLDQPYAEAHLGVLPGPYAMLAVSDTGTGMDKATQARVFEPFFTTKGHGKGTGLGLATVFGIVQQSRGHIWLYSELGLGSTFKLYFPEIDLEARPAPVPEPEAFEDAGGTETILLVEDEDLVRATVAATLRRAGYTVLEARDGDEALDLGARHPGPIDLLLTDVILPKMNGRAISDAVRGVHPEAGTLFMSGYTDDAILRHGVLEANVPFLQKPFTPSRLRMKVRETLARTRRER